MSDKRTRFVCTWCGWRRKSTGLYRDDKKCPRCQRATVEKESKPRDLRMTVKQISLTKIRSAI